MRRSSILLAVALLVVFGVPTHADDAQPSIQEQLNDLKRGQERILQELEGLRTTLEQGAAGARTEVPARPPGPVALNVHGEPFKGSSNAPVAIVEYSDFDCGHCAKFATQIFPQLDAKYVATGKVKLYFRDFPERGNAESFLKAQVARCAGEQGKFWVIHDYFFTAKPVLTGSDLSREAELIGLDLPALKQCLSQPKYALMIQRSATGAEKMGIEGTPTFVVGTLTDNGDIVRVKQVLLGAEKLAEFEKVLDELLAPSSEAGTKKAAQ
jgi:protein-disulfide isomerase